MGIYHIVIWFFLCSLLGYLLECIVLTVEYKRPVLNQGFGHGPFCIIYGFGALGASILLKPVSDSYVELYLASMIMATLMELFTASVMIHLFGSFWWDYSEKPFNYKGIICLESSLGWGFLGIVYYGCANCSLTKHSRDGNKLAEQGNEILEYSWYKSGQNPPA